MGWESCQYYVVYELMPSLKCHICEIELLLFSWFIENSILILKKIMYSFFSLISMYFGIYHMLFSRLTQYLLMDFDYKPSHITQWTIDLYGAIKIFIAFIGTSKIGWLLVKLFEINYSYLCLLFYVLDNLFWWLLVNLLWFGQRGLYVNMGWGGHRGLHSTL